MCHEPYQVCEATSSVSCIYKSLAMLIAVQFVETPSNIEV